MARIKITGGPTRKVKITGNPCYQGGGMFTTSSWTPEPVVKAPPIVQHQYMSRKLVANPITGVGEYKQVPVSEQEYNSNRMAVSNQGVLPPSQGEYYAGYTPYNQGSQGWGGGGQGNIPVPQPRPQQPQGNRSNFYVDASQGDYSIDNLRSANPYSQSCTGTDCPEFAYGGQTAPDQFGRRALDRFWPGSPSNIPLQPDEYAVGRTLPESDTPDIEAEKNEQIIGDFNGDGTQALMDVAGPPHTQGGKGVEVPDGAFVFSDTKDLKIRDKEILKEFGMPTKGRKGFTPAAIAKKYDVQKYSAKLQNPETDPITRKTAEMMTANYLKKLDMLAKVQEGMKNQMGLQNPQDVMTSQYGGYSQYQKGGKAGKVPMTQVFDPATGRMSFVPDTPGPVDPADQYSQNPFRFDQEPITKDFNLTPFYTPPLPNNIQADQQGSIAATGDSTLGNMQNTGSTAGTGKDQMMTTPAPLQKQSRAFTRPDQLAMLNSAVNYAGLHKYLPYEPPVTGVIPQTTYLDPTRALAANSEQAAMAYRGAQTANPQANMANFSAVQGQAGKQAADILGQYSNQNTQISNQANAQAAQITNGILEAQRNRLKALHQGNTIAAQQYDNAEREARADLLNVYTNAWKNRQGYNDLNQTNQFYQRDLNTGFMKFNSPQAKAAFEKATNGVPGGTDNSTLATYSKAYEQAYNNAPANMSESGKEDYADRYATAVSGMKGTTKTTTDNKSNKSRTSVTQPTVKRYGGPFSPLKGFAK